MKLQRLAVCLLSVLFALQVNSFGQKQNFEIVFEGNTLFSSETLQKELDKCPFNFRNKKDNEEIKNTVSSCLRGTFHNLYGRKGIQNLKFEYDLIVEDKNEGKKVTIFVEESEPVYMGKIKIKDFSERVSSKQHLLRIFPVKSGEVVDYVFLSKFIQGVKDLYYDRGYLSFDIDFDKNIYLNPENGLKTLDLEMDLYEGEPFIIKSVEFVRSKNPNTIKNENLTDDFLKNAFGISEGEIYSEEKFQKGLNNLNEIGGFGKLKNSRKFDIYTVSSGSSQNIDFRENSDNTVEIYILINEPYISEQK